MHESLLASASELLDVLGVLLRGEREGEVSAAGCDDEVSGSKGGAESEVCDRLRGGVCCGGREVALDRDSL